MFRRESVCPQSYAINLTFKKIALISDVEKRVVQYHRLDACHLF